MMAGMNEYCKQEGLNYSGGGGGGESRGLRRARPPRAAAVFLRGALLRGGLEPGELLRRGASLRLGLGRGAVGARRARAHRHGAEVTCGIYSRNSIRDISELQEVIEDAAGENSRGRFGRIIHFRPLKLALALGALGAAGLELSEDLRPGAHHGVALLAGVLVVKTCVSIWEARE